MALAALRHRGNANLIFRWLHDAKYRPKAATGSGEAGLRVLPREIVRDAPVTRPVSTAKKHTEIELSGGPRMRTRENSDLEVLARPIRGLAV